MVEVLSVLNMSVEFRKRKIIFIKNISNGISVCVSEMVCQIMCDKVIARMKYIYIYTIY